MKITPSFTYPQVASNCMIFFSFLLNTKYILKNVGN